MSIAEWKPASYMGMAEGMQMEFSPLLENKSPLCATHVEGYHEMDNAIYERWMHTKTKSKQTKQQKKRWLAIGVR